MANLTKSGVCYTVSESPYYYDYGGYRFYFSSLPHLSNFKDKVQIKENWLTDSLSRRFHFKVDASLIAIFQLYEQIETRGFYVISETGQEFKSVHDIEVKAVM